MPKILIVDDDLAMRTLLKEILEEFEDKGVELLTTEKEVGTIESIKAEKPELVNLDVLIGNRTVKFSTITLIKRGSDKHVLFSVSGNCE